jgi:alpha-L-fucosidase 2
LGVNPGGGGTYNNLFDAHPPFQIDGNFGCTSGIAEMLMQSADGAVHLLPALPDVWQNQGAVTGLKAIGGFEIIQMVWKDARVVKLVVKSNLGGNLRLRSPNALKLNTGILKKAKGENVNPFYQITATPQPVISSKTTAIYPELKKTFLYDVSTIAGKIYTLSVE